MTRRKIYDYIDGLYVDDRINLLLLEGLYKRVHEFSKIKTDLSYVCAYNMVEDIKRLRTLAWDLTKENNIHKYIKEKDNNPNYELKGKLDDMIINNEEWFKGLSDPSIKSFSKLFIDFLDYEAEESIKEELTTKA